MDTKAIIEQLKAECDRINLAIRALEGIGSNGSDLRARAVTPKKQGGISAAGRRKLSQMMKARWAARRKAATAKATPAKTAAVGKKK